MTTHDARTLTDILDTDARRAADAAERTVIAASVELAPLSWADARGVSPAELGAALAGLPAHLVRAQAVRFLVERRKPWGWGDVDTLAAWLAAQIAAAGTAAKEDPMDVTPSAAARACLAIAEECRDAAAGHTVQGNGEAARDLASAARAATKAAFYAETPGVARWVGEALLVRSSQAGGVVYRVGRGGCECEAAQHSRPCWHQALFAGYERAADELGAERDAELDARAAYGVAA